MSNSTTSFDPLVDQKPSRFVVGIDLGTTNSAVTYVDTLEQPWAIRVLPVPQLVAPGEVESRDTLPSFHYQPAAGELADGALRLPWSKHEPGHATGVYAREQGASAPGRLISSAKSWLCHTGVDRTAGLLPWRGAADVEKLSPVEAASRYLDHIRAAWDANFKTDLLADQDIVLTLPASFDEVARELTVEAAALAGLHRVVLIEEPQAAFYSWVYRHSNDWEELVKPGQKILICDIGGGTSDFTLIRVRRSSEINAEATHKIQFHRVAVGDHLILGGDNLDLALATYLEQKIKPSGKLQPRQWDVLVRRCRQAKETLLVDDAPPSMKINLPGSGTKLIGGGVNVEVTREEAMQVLVEGFFPTTPLDSRPQTRTSGFQEFGLPYAPDAGITRYLAAFLTAHRHVAMEELEEDPGFDPARPDIVLFNGGLMESASIRQQLVTCIEQWFSTSGEPWTPQVLDNEQLYLAVAQGAAYYGMVRRGEGVRIAASLARSYYIGVQSDPPQAVCVAPGNAEPGQENRLDNREFQLQVSQPVEFPLFVSSTRLTDAAGALVGVDAEQMKPLPPVRTVLKTQRKSDRGEIAVHLHSRLTEIGTVDLWCSEAAGDRSWRLQFDVRSATQTDIEAHQSAAEIEGVVDEQQWLECRRLLEEVFGPEGAAKPGKLMKELSAAIGSPRADWPTSLLRRIWESLVELQAGRRKSPPHEARWLNLAGYALRPGYGLAVDDWRVAETWRNVQGKLAHGAGSTRTESLILWRRIAGGLSAGQQQAIAEPLIAPVRGLHRRLTTGRGGAADQSFSPQESHEVWRLLGSLELLQVSMKVELGNMLVELYSRKKMQPVRPAMLWALGRLGQRVPVYGPLNTVAPGNVAARWLETLMDDAGAADMDHFAVMQMARKTGDRYRDLPAELRQSTAAWLEDNGAPQHYITLVRDGGELQLEEQGQVFGESLPMGLRI